MAFFFLLGGGGGPLERVFSREPRCGSGARPSRTGDRVEKTLVVDGFQEKIKCAVLHRPHRHIDVAVTGEKNDRERNAAAPHLMLSLNPAHARHAHVEHHAARLRRGISREEVFCPPVGDRFPSFHIQHEAQGFAQIRFIIHNAHQSVHLREGKLFGGNLFLTGSHNAFRNFSSLMNGRCLSVLQHRPCLRPPDEARAPARA